MELFLLFSVLITMFPRWKKSVLQPAIAAMHELHSLVQCDNKASPFRSVPVNVLPRWSSNRKHRGHRGPGHHQG